MAEPEEIIRRHDMLANSRKTWEAHWDEVADLTDPTRSSITRQFSPGAKRRGRLYDSTGTHSGGLLASSLLGAMTNPGGRWFGFATQNRSLMDSHEVVIWLSEAENAMFRELARSNFYLQAHEVYLDLVYFGTSALYEEWNTNALALNFDTIPLGEYFVAENARGVIDTLSRCFILSARQQIEEFGAENVSLKVKQAIENKKPEQEFTIIHSVYPNAERMVGREDYKGKRFYSCYLDKDAKHIIKEGGYEEFPYQVPRWMVSPGERYGRSPAMTALPDMKVLNKAIELDLRAWAKAIDPPLMVANDGIIGKIRTTPAALMTVRTDLMVKGIDPIRPFPVGAKFDVTQVKVQELREAVRRAFFVDQLQLQEGPQMTATEVVQRQEEKLRLLAPIIGRLQAEFLQPLVERTFAILLREGRLGQPPEALQGRDLKIEFIGPMARIQRMQEAQSLQRLLVEIGGTLGAIKPEIFDNINGDEAIRLSAEVYGCPPKLLLTTAKVAELRQARAQAQQQAMQKDDMERAGTVMAKMQAGGRR